MATDTDSASYYSARLSQLDAKISAIIDNPRPNYRVGSVVMNYNDLLKTLWQMRADTLQRMTEKPFEVFETVQTDIDAFGKDFTTYLNSPVSVDLAYPIR